MVRDAVVTVRGYTNTHTHSRPVTDSYYFKHIHKHKQSKSLEIMFKKNSSYIRVLHVSTSNHIGNNKPNHSCRQTKQHSGNSFWSLEVRMTLPSETIVKYHLQRKKRYLKTFHLSHKTQANIFLHK